MKFKQYETAQVDGIDVVNDSIEMLQWTRATVKVDVPSGEADDVPPQLAALGFVLPTRKELLSHVDEEHMDPAIDGWEVGLFHCLNKPYWTRTPVAKPDSVTKQNYGLHLVDDRWGVYFSQGQQGHLSMHDVACVRYVRPLPA